MTQPFVIVPASVMCLVFWYCLTLDKIKASFKRDFDVKSGRKSSISIDVSKTDDNEEESCMGKGPCRGLSKGYRNKDSAVLHVNQILVRTVAWVIVVGDGFCNVVDGLTSAAAFSVSFSKVFDCLYATSKVFLFDC